MNRLSLVLFPRVHMLSGLLDRVLRSINKEQWQPIRRRARRSTRQVAHTCRPWLRMLEDRLLLSNLPVITWASPADIVYGTPLSATQLDATADVPGRFSYSPPIGTMFAAGQNQPLSVTFIPNDTVNY